MTRLSQRTPLRIKLITALLALVALALAVISFTSVAVFSGYLENQVDNQVQALATQSASAPLRRHQSELSHLVSRPRLTRSSTPRATRAGLATASRSGSPVPTCRRFLLADRACGPPGDRAGPSGGGQWRIISSPCPTTQDGSPATGTLVIGDNLGNINHTIGYLTSLDVIVSLIIMLGLAVVGVAVVRTNLRPLDDIEETAEEITAGHLDRRVPDRDRQPKSGGWAGRSTRCWPRSNRRSMTGSSRRRRRSSPRSGCAASSRTPATNCARR